MSISLTVPSNTVTVAGGRGSLTASVTNGSSVPARIVLGAFDPPEGTGGASSAVGWTRIDRPARDIPAGATEQFAVMFVPEEGTGPGRYPVRFIAYSAEQAPEENADQAQPVEVVVPEVAPPPPVPKKRWWPYAAVAAVLVLAVGLVVWLLLPGGDTVVVPDWTGDDRQTVQAQADLLELEVEFDERIRDPGSTAAPGTVIDQSPLAGSEVTPGAEVRVVLALGLILPDWTGRTTAEVMAEAGALGLTNVSFTDRIDSRFPRGTIIDQDPGPNTLVSPDEAITVVRAQTGIIPTFNPTIAAPTVAAPPVERPVGD